MRGQLIRRLEELKREFTEGQKRASELEQQQATLHQTLLRISGAIQVLEEELKVQSQDTALNNGTSVSDAAQADLSLVNGSREHVAP
jgi:predicted nuclease with TOPRIM domain